MLSNQWNLCCVSYLVVVKVCSTRSVVVGADVGFSWWLWLLLAPTFWFSSVMARG
jgi:hypothetical protein